MIISMTQLNQVLSWPPEYTVKKHRRAKSVKLRASRSHGLEITIPYRFSLKNLPPILEENKTWILQQLERLQPFESEELATTISLRALNETWKINYLACDAKLELMQRPDRELVLIGKIEDKDLCKAKLGSWIKKIATQYLTQQINEISKVTKLNYSSVRIRDQKSVWGTCHSDKTISLNYKLIFLPPELVRYVIIHELCHTQFLNHSLQFWNLVLQHDSNWREHRRNLRKVEVLIPNWI